MVWYTTLEDNGAPPPDTEYFRTGIRLQSHDAWAGFAPAGVSPRTLQRYSWQAPSPGYPTFINGGNGPSRSWDLSVPDLTPASGVGEVTGAYSNVSVSIGDFSGPLNDTWTFNYGGTVSALSALNADGDESDGVFRTWTTFTFDMEPTIGGVPDAVVSSVTFGDMPTLGPYETMRLRLIGSESASVDLGAGDAGGTFDIQGQTQYLLIVEYEIRIPFGVDPTFAVSYSMSTGTTSTGPDPVPEPTSLLLTGLGAVGLVYWRRRRVT